MPTRFCAKLSDFARCGGVHGRLDGVRGQGEGTGKKGFCFLAQRQVKPAIVAICWLTHAWPANPAWLKSQHEPYWGSVQSFFALQSRTVKLPPVGVSGMFEAHVGLQPAPDDEVSCVP